MSPWWLYSPSLFHLGLFPKWNEMKGSVLAPLLPKWWFSTKNATEGRKRHKLIQLQWLNGRRRRFRQGDIIDSHVNKTLCSGSYRPSPVTNLIDCIWVKPREKITQVSADSSATCGNTMCVSAWSVPALLAVVRAHCGVIWARCRVLACVVINSLFCKFTSGILDYKESSGAAGSEIGIPAGYQHWQGRGIPQSGDVDASKDPAEAVFKNFSKLL